VPTKKKDTRREDRHNQDYAKQFDRDNYDHINFKFRKDSGIKVALKLACLKTGLSQNEYIREALLDRFAVDDITPFEK